MYPLNDLFADPQGRWDQYAPYDATEYYDNAKGFLTTQRHVDIRTFRTIVGAGAEPWTLSGLGLGSLTTGAIATRGGWPGLQVVTTGAAVSAQLLSVLLTPIDISAMDDVSLILPDYNSFDTTSYIQFTSDPHGSFGVDGWGIDQWGLAQWGSPSGSTYTSAQVAFSNNTSTMPQLLLAVSLFSASAGSNFSLSNITGVRIVLTKATAPAVDQTVTLMALRGLKTSWEESLLDFDTQAQAIYVPVTLTGNATGSTVAQNFEFIRGNGSSSDPVPVDGAYQIYFYPGGQTSPNDAQSPDYNNLDILVREIKDTTAGTGSFIVARVKWNATSSEFECQRIDMTGGAGGTRTTTTLHSQTIGGELLTNTHYMFRVEMIGTQLIGKLYYADANSVTGEQVWASTPVSTSDFVVRNGRVGFMAGLLTRDAYVMGWSSATVGYATLTTDAYRTYTPVDGAQLAAKFAADLNLWSSWTGADVAVDPTKTISGAGSFSASQAITSNQFIVDDWTQTYLSLAIWVGSAVTAQNQPVVYLNTPSGTEQLVVDRLYPNQWNQIKYDLSAFAPSLLTGIGYSIAIAPSTNPDRALGTFWVDKMTVGRRRVAWEFRATQNGTWRQFRDQVNTATGGLHLNPEERGTYPQLQARALTNDAWVAIAGGPKLILHFAPLGNPVYDQAALTTPARGASLYPGWGAFKWGLTPWGL